MAERAHLSIGEVLSLLQSEFPDVTISKIRFLESQGLLDPERTPSGYRKFYESDVERLRWILRQQRENFLPLKVIKGRLLGEDAGLAEQPPAAAGQATPAKAPPASQPVGAGPGEAEGPRPDGAALSPDPTGANLTLEELASASGLAVDRVRDLERAGFFAGQRVADAVYYDEECLTVAKLVAGFARFGIEPRHLRMYKSAAEREAGLVEQVIVPLLKQRNPRARRQAMEAVEELSELGQRLRAVMVRRAIRGLTG